MNVFIGERASYWANKTITVERTPDGVKFSNGYELTDFHEQDCCESVYADWSSLDDTGFFNSKFSRIALDFVKGVGFRINGYTVHCYNSQNGYYSSSLALVVKLDGKEVSTLDISDYLEDNIC